MKKSESIKELAQALNKAQAQMSPAIKDSTNPFFKSHYADLESVWDAIREPLHSNGLVISQLTGFNETGLPVVETMLIHQSGEWILGEFPLITKDNTPQAMGSACSYARRYALAAIMGVVQVDDDGEAAQARLKPQVVKEHLVVDAVVNDYLAPGAELPPMKPKEVKKAAAIPLVPKLGDYVISIGKKHKGKKLKEVPRHELKGFLEWLITQPETNPVTRDFIKNTRAYLETT